MRTVREHITVQNHLRVYGMGPFRVLYIDMNSFFASVEQHLNPELRGKPVAITAMENEAGACVAASYEAKAYGIKTGTTVRDARRLCPDVIFKPSQHRTYVRFNLRIASILDRHAELVRIRSVDEFQLALSGETTTLAGAVDLVGVLKASVAEEIGPSLRFSAGLGANQLTAKIAGKLQKPDGLKWLCTDNMPEAIAHLALEDLPGVSGAMRQRLERAGIMDVPALCRLDPRHARAIWRSVEGERFVRALQGELIPLPTTKRGGFGNSKVLAPDLRDALSAYLVTRWLIEKAAARLRRENRVAGIFTLQISRENAAPLARTVKCAQSQDTAVFLRINRHLWRQTWRLVRGHRIGSVGIQLGQTDLLERRNGDLFRDLPAAERTAGERVAAAVDFINGRFGAGSITYGQNKPHPGFFERGS